MSSVDTAKIAINSNARVCKTRRAIDLPPSSIIDLSDVVTPRPAIAKTKDHCDTLDKNSESSIGIYPLLLTTRHTAKASANQGKAFGLIDLDSPLLRRTAIMMTMIGSIEILKSLMKVAISPVSFDTA